MAKVICMASAKGGSGKTVLTSTFATFLTAIGKKVLIIDTDASTNGHTLMYLKEVMVHSELVRSKRQTPKGIFEYSGAEDDVIETVRLENKVDFIPASFSFKNTESCDINLFRRAIQRCLFRANSKYDFVFLDAQAGSDSFAGISMNREISDQVIIVSEYDPLSAAGIERLKGIFRDDLTYDRTWVLLNKMLPDFVQSFSDFLEVAKYLSPIPWDAEVVKSYARRKLAVNLEYGNEFTLAVIQTLKSFFGNDIEDSLKAWLNDRSAILREPVALQLMDAERELKIVFEEKERARKKGLIRLFNIVIVGTLFLFGIVSFGIYTLETVLLKENTFENKILYVIPIVLILISVIYPLLKEFISGRGTYGSEEINNKISTLNEKIRKLEGLKSASIENLIKYKSNGR